MGGYLNVGDIPPNLSTAEEEECLHEYAFIHEDRRQQARKRWAVYGFSMGPIHVRNMLLSAHCRNGKIPDYVFRRDAELDCRVLYPENEPWILRNLTTREFMRVDAISLRSDFIHGPDIDVLGFGHVLRVRSSWIEAGSTRDLNLTSLGITVWAGHRSDITTLGRHRSETGGTVSALIGKSI